MAMSRPPLSVLKALIGACGLSAGFVCLAVLSACAPNLGPMPKLTQPQDYATAQSFDAPSADWPTDNWWTVYQDPQLDSLEAEALQGAPDLRIAEARVRDAQSDTEQVGAQRFPQLGVSGSEDESRISQSLGLPSQISGFIPNGFHPMTQVGVNLTYDLDFFGKNRAALAAATSDAEAEKADRAAARLELTIAVATAYADFLRLSEDRDDAAQAVRVRQDTLKLVGQRRSNGLETRGDVSEQDATVSASQAQVESLDFQILQQRHQIAALLGKGPDRGLAVQRTPHDSIVLRPFGLPPTVALDLVGRRPDIVAARLRAEAARQRIKSAKADFYPNIDLAGSFAAYSFNGQNILDHNFMLAQLGPALKLPIFTGGKIEGAYRGARAEYDEAVATYDKTLATALKEVADAIAGERSLQTQLKDARASLAADEDAYNVAKLRYQGGLSPYLNVLTAENTVLQQRQTVVNQAVLALNYDLALVRALGGGFNQPAPAAHPQSTR
jgi:NodT family efflux transporter outer membrane factor (OMF) lipoprotein